jgi:glycosyltransferase involved in cell wall biosynthesis
MANSGGDQKKVALRANELGIDDAVHFLGFCKNLPAALSAADVGLFTARSSEGTSRAILEWMALGKPVVATDVGAVRELLENDIEGLIVPPENPAVLAETMERIFLDPDLRNRMGEASRKRAEAEYDRLVWTRKWVNLYRKALGLKRAKIDDSVPTSGITESTS